MKKVLIKFVRKANMWCKTILEKGEQIQEWFKDIPKR